MPDSTHAKTKICCRCKVEKPLDGFAKDRQTPDGLQRRCRTCKTEEARERRANNPVALEQQRAATKRWRDRDPENARRLAREYRDSNREAALKSQREWRIRNPDSARAYRDANRDRVRELDRAWRKANPEKVAEIAKRSRDKRYLADPTAAIEAANRRRALIQDRKVGRVDLPALWEAQGGLCALCGSLIDVEAKWPARESRSIDHIVPLAKGGTHEQSNLQWTHLVCNLKKGASVPTDSPS